MKKELRQKRQNDGMSKQRDLRSDADSDRDRARRREMMHRGEYVTREINPAKPATYETR